jgi:aminoglycoside phosphotransferase (APT) family kinase protein
LNCEGELITLVHGDLHNNNMMFLEREEEGDMHFKLLDWQMVKVGSKLALLFIIKSISSDPPGSITDSYQRVNSYG